MSPLCWPTISVWSVRRSRTTMSTLAYARPKATRYLSSCSKELAKVEETHQDEFENTKDFVDKLGASYLATLTGED